MTAAAEAFAAAVGAAILLSVVLRHWLLMHAGPRFSRRTNEFLVLQDVVR